MDHPSSEQQIRALYAAFNRRDSSFVTERMAPDATWPRAFKGGVVQGPAAVGAYWEQQWSEIDPTVEPMSISQLEDGRFDVEVHQVVRDLQGAVLLDELVHHLFTFEGGLIAHMELPLAP